jgi:hypothetical protein
VVGYFGVRSQDERKDFLSFGKRDTVESTLRGISAIFYHLFGYFGKETVENSLFNKITPRLTGLVRRGA